MNNFTDLVNSPVLRKNLATQGFVTPTPVQAQAIPPASLGRDLVATAQTGTGKTLAFSLPIIESLLSQPLTQGPQALILSPTRELALQIHEVVKLLTHGTGIKAAVVVGGMSEAGQLKSLRQGAQIVIATPGRLCDFLDRKLVGLAAIRVVVLDEADRMLDMGFLPAVESILRKTLPTRQTLFFSATLETSVTRLISKHLKDPVRITVGSISKPADKIDMHVYEVDQDRKLALLHHLLVTNDGSFLVFARTKRGAERLAKKLHGAGVKSSAIHGDRSQNQRNMALKGFQNGQYRVLVATDVAARGIHVDNIAHVVNYDLPQQAEDFIHRVGRTGRAGATGVASTFAARAERRDVQNIERVLKTRLTQKETPDGLGREERGERGAEVIEIPMSRGFGGKSAAGKPFAAKSQSFRPRRRFGAGR
jgi:ATP-dependent RNA helicase RhlE